MRHCRKSAAVFYIQEEYFLEVEGKCFEGGREKRYFLRVEDKKELNGDERQVRGYMFKEKKEMPYK